MGSFRKINETILGVDILTLIFRGTELKTTNTIDIHKLADKIAQLQMMYCCCTNATPAALKKKLEAEIILLQCLIGEKPGILAECGIDLSANGIIKTAQNINYACVKGFNPKLGAEWNTIITNHALLKPIILTLENPKIFNQEEQLKLEGNDMYSAYPWDAFEETYITKEILTLINSLSTNSFVYKIILASLMPDSTETLLLTQCADGHCRIAAHWGPEPLSFKIAGLHPK